MIVLCAFAVGLMERYVGHSGVMRDDEACALKGTPTYLSVRVTDGATPGRNDELEALVRSEHTIPRVLET